MAEYLATVCRTMYDKRVLELRSELEVARRHVAELEARVIPRPQGDPAIAAMRLWTQFYASFEDTENTLGWYMPFQIDDDDFDTKEITAFVNGFATFSPWSISLQEFLEHIEPEFIHTCTESFRRQRGSI